MDTYDGKLITDYIKYILCYILTNVCAMKMISAGRTDGRTATCTPFCRTHKEREIAQRLSSSIRQTPRHDLCTYIAKRDSLHTKFLESFGHIGGIFLCVIIVVNVLGNHIDSNTYK